MDQVDIKLINYLISLDSVQCNYFEEQITKQLSFSST